jgi:hypothetical protein
MILLGLSACSLPGQLTPRRFDRLFADERALTGEDRWRQRTTACGFDDRLPSRRPQTVFLEADRELLRRCTPSIAARWRNRHRQLRPLDFGLQRIQLAQYRERRAPLNSDSGFYADRSSMHSRRCPTKDYENYFFPSRRSALLPGIATCARASRTDSCCPPRSSRASRA